jgi:fido (protein-threonine AMPylation protein)
MSEYKKQIYEYTPEEKQLYWNIGTGLQAVDNLKPSSYLETLIHRNVQGEIDLDAVESALQEYYQTEGEEKAREKEADIVSARITKYLQESEFTLHPLALKQIHGYLFKGFDEVAPGEYKTANYGKAEAILNGFSVRYEDHKNVATFLEYDIEKEKEKTYQVTSPKETVEGISSFISGIWQIHPFKEGNTRTVAVFAIQYLKSQGFEVGNEPFEKHAKYFRDALVRANFSDLKRNVNRDMEPLNQFLYNVMYHTQYELNRENLIVHELFAKDKTLQARKQKKKEVEIDL